MNTYIVRVYRQEQDNPRMLVGLVEKPGGEKREVFKSLDELWTILAHAKKEKKKRDETKAARKRQ